jgi:hypothetical protein
MSDIGDESIGDREEIWTRIEELRQEEVSFCEARCKAVQEWIENFLLENCIKITNHRR